jgi:glycosyltransferase involved in cell wall biosynthesis
MNLTAHMMLRNEEYWAPYILEQLLPVMDEIIIADTGSRDATVNVLREVLREVPGCPVRWMLYDELNPRKNGECRQWMTDMTKTEWAVIIDGDEWYSHEALERMKSFPVQSHHRLGFTTLQVLQHKDGKFWLAEKWSKQALFYVPDTKWGGSYPFEGPTNYNQPETYFYYPDVVGLDFHHLKRSSQDKNTPHRHDEIRLEQPVQESCGLPFILGRWPNPYV